MQETMKNRYSCRKFSGEKLGDEIVREIINLTRLSPSSCGLEPWKFVVFSQSDDIKKLGEICNYQPQVSTCSHLVVIVARNDLKVGDEYLDKCVRRRATTSEKYNAAMAYFRDKFKDMDEKAMTNYASKQCYLACANLVNVAESFGVKSCIIAGFDGEKLTKYVRSEANLNEHFTPILVVSLGKGENIKFPHTRHSLDDVLIWR